MPPGDRPVPRPVARAAADVPLQRPPRERVVTAPTPLVAVLLGTDHHPFDRLVDWSREVRRATGADVFVQHGATTLPPDLTGAAVLGLAELSSLLDRAAVVVTHGGPGLIMEARAAGHLPVVVPRDPRLGEHVDDHQQRFVARIAGAGFVAAAQHLPDFRRAVSIALVGGRGAPAGPVPPGGTPPGDGPVADLAPARFGRLVDELLHRT
ncbi:glycosyl transferase family 28 [Nocardioides sp. zg-579]|uniref:Glycosyl transferase family 28 n=1 Tax=Nocardioides marmotae TaxID=2663857 RepID=A0A6I3JEU9_9ACTN|nr:glycosyl transferase family 28 [Gordonia jinghuaiqii]MTB96585.1 glycosyl transferase family 28 [Nocardioides marmotae]